jgi:hypothetical protein
MPIKSVAAIEIHMRITSTVTDAGRVRDFGGSYAGAAATWGSPEP